VATSDGEADALAAIEAAALAADGVPELNTRLEAAEEVLGAATATLDEAVLSCAELLRRRAELASGEDAFSQRALDTLHEQIEGETIATLRSDAIRTHTEEDDAI